jgi:hypothetical protein
VPSLPVLWSNPRFHLPSATRSGSKSGFVPSALSCPDWACLALRLASCPSYVAGGSAFAAARVHAFGRFVSWTSSFPRTCSGLHNRKESSLDGHRIMRGLPFRFQIAAQCLSGLPSNPLPPRGAGNWHSIGPVRPASQKTRPCAKYSPSWLTTGHFSLSGEHTMNGDCTSLLRAAVLHRHRPNMVPMGSGRGDDASTASAALTLRSINVSDAPSGGRNATTCAAE